MNIADMKTSDDWFKLIKDQYTWSSGTAFIAVSEIGWGQCERQFYQYQSDLAGLPAVIMGVPVRIVGDIADTEIELRRWPDSDHGEPAILT